MTDGYKALREGAAWLDLTGRGVINVEGEDRARLLHAMSTNHIERLQPGQFAYAFFLNAQGRMLADVNVLCQRDTLMLDTEPSTRARVWEHLDKFIIADDVELRDVTDLTAVIGVEGPNAADVAAKAGFDTTWHISSTGAPGVRLFVAKVMKPLYIAKLESLGAVAASMDDAEAVRLEHAKPKYGSDLSDAHIPHEARLLGAVHFSKGCYLGQEIVERVRSRGRPNRLLTHLEVDAQSPIAVGAKLMADGKEVGDVTSSAYSPAEGKVLMLGYVRSEFAAPGKQVEVDGHVATATARLTETAAT